MIALDTNVLVHAFRTESPFHDKSLSAIIKLRAGSTPIAVPWACVHEFLGIVTHPTRMKPPASLSAAMAFVRSLLADPKVRLLHEAPEHLDHLEQLLITSQVRGPAIHDARIAAICLAHRVQEILTSDRDFSRFAQLHVRNPTL
jgi:uncharacterized protein